jgi:RND family efflux transporter MFP subunit
MRIQVTTCARRQRAGALLGIVVALAACGKAPPATPVAQATVLESLVVDAGGGTSGRGWDGVVEATRSAVLSAQTSGRIESIAVDVDDRVAAGAVLLRITATEQTASTSTAQAQLRSAEAQAVEAESRYRRAADMVERQLVSRQEFEQVRAGRDSAVAARDAAAAQLAQIGQQLAYTVVRAPYAGIVSRRHVETGETVAPGQGLLELYAPDALRMEVQVPQGDAQLIRGTSAARIVMADGRQVEATRVIVYPSADPGSHSVSVRVLLPAMQNAPRPGETLRVVFPVGGDAGLWLPATAVLTRGELTGVYVLQDGAILLRQLRLGRREGGRVEVIAGLAAGERIATDPLAAVQALSRRRAGAAGQRD